MISLNIECIAVWVSVAIAAVFFWKKKSWSKLERFKIIITVLSMGIALTAMLVGFNSLFRTMRLEREAIIPKLQLVPSDIDSGKQLTTLGVVVRNYSDYDALNIRLDVKLGDSEWRRELEKAVSKEAFMRYAFPIVGKNGKSIHDQFLQHPEIPELLAGKSVTMYFGDPNRSFFEKIQFAERRPDGTDVTIPFSETSTYKSSSGWFEALQKASSGNPLSLFVRARWENRIVGRQFDLIAEYRVLVTRIGNAESTTFLPVTVHFNDFNY